jgi:hypothetical protein
VQHHRRFTVGIAAGLPVDELSVSDVQQTMVIRVDLRIDIAFLLDPTRFR